MDDSKFVRIKKAVGLAAVAIALGAGPLLAQTGTIQGTVRSAVTSEALQGARVTLDGTQLVGQTDTDGRYTITGVPAGIYSVRVQMIGFQTVILSNQQVTGGAPRVTNFELSPSILRLEGVVVTGVAEATEIVKLPFVEGSDAFEFKEIVASAIANPAMLSTLNTVMKRANKNFQAN